MTTGQRIKQIRQEAGMKQDEFAAAIGCPKQVLSNVEREYTGIKTELLAEIARRFSVSVDYLLGLTDIRSDDYVAIADEDERDLLQNFRSMDKKERRILLGAMEEIMARRR